MDMFKTSWKVLIAIFFIVEIISCKSISDKDVVDPDNDRWLADQSVRDTNHNQFASL